MKVPKSGKEISRKWAEYILEESMMAANQPTLIRVNTCSINKETGDGFNSEVVFFTVETTEKDEASLPEVKKVYHLVGKFLSQNPQTRVFNKKLKSTVKEYIVYTDLINAMNNMLSAKAPEEPQISLPKLIYGKCTSKEFVLVMENLQYAGYEMNDKRKGLSGEQLKIAADQIARVHATSYVFSASGDMSKYSMFPSTEEYMNTFIMMIEVMLDSIIKFLKSSKETEELSKKLHLCNSALIEKSIASIKRDYKIRCLIHGDYWNNNFMFKYADSSDSQNSIERVKVIDWGNSSWGPPLFDIQYLVYTSTTRSVRENHLDEVLNHYYQTFMKLATTLSSAPVNWSHEEFMNEWNDAYVQGFLLGCTLTQGTLSENNPFNNKPKPSVLDNALLVPIKFVVDGMKMGAANILAPLTLTTGGQKYMKSFVKRMMKPILEELISGKNEVMNKRVLDLIYEADESGLFTT